MVQEPLALSCKTKRQHGRPRPKPNGRSTTIPPSHSRAILSLGAKVKVKHGLWWNVCWCKRRSNGFMWWLQRDGFIYMCIPYFASQNHPMLPFKTPMTPGRPPRHVLSLRKEQIQRSQSNLRRCLRRLQIPSIQAVREAKARPVSTRNAGVPSTLGVTVPYFQTNQNEPF